MSVGPGQRVGRYEVLRKLGQGGFGIIYVGRDVELDREVALKFLRPEHLTRQDVVQRFLQEARSAAKINHPGIVTVFECGQVAGTNTRADGTVYIAMELLTGESLAMRLKRNRQMPPSMVLGITRQLCSALQAAHLAGIVHRDLKPDNIFLIPDAALRDGLRVKILDFGVAKLADGQFSGGVRTHSAMVLGTPTYMSPEQCKSSAKVDHRSDIYALGCIFYELLCGARPYDGDAGEQIAKHQLAPVPVPRARNPNIPIELDHLVTQMLAKAPDDRPGSMELVDEAIAAFERVPTTPASGYDETMMATVPRAKTPPPVKDAPGTAMTVFEGEHAPTRASTARPSRAPLYAGAAGVTVLGILLGVIVTRGGGGDKPEPPTPPPAPVSASAPPDAALAPDTAIAPSRADVRPDDVKMKCVELTAAKRWANLQSCTNELASLDGPTAATLRTKAAMETKAESAQRNLADDVKAGEIRKAKGELDKIPPDSVYRVDASAAYATALDAATNDYERRARAAAADKKCSAVDKIIREANAEGAGEKARTVPCKAEVATKGPQPAQPATPECNPDALRQKGEDHLQTGMDAAALGYFEASMKCRPDAALMRFAFMAACRSKNVAKAKYYYPKLPPATTTGIVQICKRNGIPMP